MAARVPTACGALGGGSHAWPQWPVTPLGCWTKTGGGQLARGGVSRAQNLEGRGPRRAVASPVLRSPGPAPQDVPEQRSMEYPKLYEPGQLNLLFNKREFFICIAQGIYASVLVFFLPYGVFAEAARDDGAQLADYQSFAVTVATSLVIVVSVQVGGGARDPLPPGGLPWAGRGTGAGSACL